MMKQRVDLYLATVLIVGFGWPAATAQEHNHNGHSNQIQPAPVKPPQVFLDKSPKIVEYQLKRLSNAELLLIETKHDDTKYAPVFSAILSRPGMASGARRQALTSLARLRKTSEIVEGLRILSTPNTSDPEQERVASEIAQILLSKPLAELSASKEALKEVFVSSKEFASRACLAILISCGEREWVVQIVKTDPLKCELLKAVTLLPKVDHRLSFLGTILERLEDPSNIELQQQAIRTSLVLTGQEQKIFPYLVRLVDQESVFHEAVEALLKIPRSAYDPTLSSKLANLLVVKAEATTADERTKESFVNVSQLIESLLPVLEEKEARDYRTRMEKIAVRVIRIGTVLEEMRYDLKYFAVQRGKPVQIWLQNNDLMPHNLVVTVPGALKEIAMLAATMTPDASTNGKQYVPVSDKVLFSSNMVQAGKQDRITFNAPEVIGEYPFVCTYPNHWMRMYGVMVVVDDLDAFLKSPTEPKDPIGNNRSFVKNWKLEDFSSESLSVGLRGRSPDLGAKIYREATCLLCHKIQTQGGNVGPDLTDVLERWKGDSLGVIREILEPSHKIDAKYATRSVLTTEGKVYSGLVIAEDKDSISIVSTPEQSAGMKIAKDEIESMVQSSKSLMPAALLDQFTRDEIMELLAYLLVDAPKSKLP